MTLIFLRRRNIKMIIRTEAVVIREQATGERDKLLTLLTREKGIIKAFANGARSPKNRNANTTDVFCYSDMSLTKGKSGAYSLRESCPKDVFFSLRGDIVKLSLAQYICELAEELAPREEPAEELFSLFLNCLHLLANTKKDIYLIKAAAELRMLTLSGYMPAIVACDSCGTYESEKMYFSTFTGKLYCEKCKPEEKTVTLGLGVVTAMRHICFSDPEKVFRFKMSKDGLSALCAVSEKYMKSVTMRNYKTLEFFKYMTE